MHIGLLRIITVGILACIFSGAAAIAAEPAFVWIEGEAPAQTGIAFGTNATARPHLLSGGQWLNKVVDADKVGGVPSLQYAVKVPAAGHYEIWARVGFNLARPAIEWRLGEAEWKRIEGTVPTFNTMELAEFSEVGWLQLGESDLQAGATTLDIRFIASDKANAKMLMGVDCFALVQGKFVPEGKLQPGQQYDAETDQQASGKIFDLPAPKGAERSSISLNGLWQAARWDEADMDAAPHKPVESLPGGGYPLRWMGMSVPGSLWKKDETIFAHRVLYRTRVQIPAEARGRAFHLEFDGTNWLASVFINGKLAGTHRGVWVPWTLDVTSLIEAGKTNTIEIAIKGPYYAMDTVHMKKSLDELSTRPRTRMNWVYWYAPIYPSTKGEGNGVDYGIVNPLRLVCSGNAYTDDVFVKTSVEKKQLSSDVTIRNTDAKDRKFEVRCEAVYDRDNKVEKTFDPVAITVPAGRDATVSVGGAWENPKLWWPSTKLEEKPHLYRLRTTILEDGKPLDVHEQLFGFREVTIRGTGMYINGVRRNFWNWVTVGGRPSSQEEWLVKYFQNKDRFQRICADLSSWPNRQTMLDFFDRNGVPGRLSTCIDGMFISYALVDGKRDEKRNGVNYTVNELVWENFREHMAQVVKAYRNHPSIFTYQVENELVYINGQNRYSDAMDLIQDEMAKVAEAGRALDSTRSYNVGGAGDLGGRLEINSPHYPEGRMDWYPENAYTLKNYAEHVSRWPWDRSKPWIVGESAFANEIGLGSYVSGDAVYRSREEANRGKAKFLRMLYGGYRWTDAAGFFPWDCLPQFEDSQKIFSPLCAIPRRQTSRLYGGQENSLLFKIMNDTLSRAPVTFEWSYTIGEKRIAGDKRDLTIEPGFGVEQTITINPPASDARVEGKLTLKVTQPGAEEYVDVRSVPVLPRGKALKTSGTLLVLDRSGKLDKHLEKTGAKFEKLKDLEAARTRDGLLLIGPDTLTEHEAISSALLAFAAKGGRAIVLEQDAPAISGSLPVEIKTTNRFGGFAHPQALGTPLFRDLGAEDLIDWAAGHPTYKNAYLKPSQGATSLVACNDGLDHSALLEVPAGNGVIVLCQLRLGANLGVDPAADVLLRNLVEQYGTFAPKRGVVAVVATTPALRDAISASGAKSSPAENCVAALDPTQFKVALIEATPDNLQALIKARDKAEAFQRAGGWILLQNLTPDGLATFNEIVGGQYLIRPFRVERVTLQHPEYALAAALGNQDLAMFSAKPLQHGRMWISGDVFTHVVDVGEDAAPFTLPPGAPDDPQAYTPTFDDKDPYNFVNGLYVRDHWRYIRQIWVPQSGAEPLVFKFQRPETLRQINIANNDSYWTIRELDLIFDGDEASAVRVELPDESEVKEIPLPQPRTVNKTLTLQVRSWRESRPGPHRLVGIDNVQFLRAAPPRAVSLDSVGGLVAFPQDPKQPAQGGVLLNQLNLASANDTAENRAKKLRVLGVLLNNMGVGAASQETVVVPGLNLKYQPVSLVGYCNRYLKEINGNVSWFGQKDLDLRALPVGPQNLGHVNYDLIQFTTAPMPDCVMLSNGPPLADLPQEVKGIPIGRKADVLFFLQAAHVWKPINSEERKRIGNRNLPFKLPEIAQYTLHYADGQTVSVPVVLEQHVDHWLQDEPKALPNAVLGWNQAIDAAGGKKAVLYSMQFANPRRDVVIQSIDFTLRKDSRATPALLAITTGHVVSAK